MKGLELCESYFREVGLPVLERECPEILDRMAIGLVGDGSECYGYDDEISRDHDWGPGFCIWLPKDDYEAIGRKVQEIYERMPRTYKGYGPRLISQWGDHRIGALEIGAFYRQFIGKYQPPNNYDEWLDLAGECAGSSHQWHGLPGPLGRIHPDKEQPASVLSGRREADEDRFPLHDDRASGTIQLSALCKARGIICRPACGDQILC